MKKKTQLIHDIARKTGVSIATAYRAVNAPHRVAADTRRQILKGLEERNIFINRRTRVSKRPRLVQEVRRVAFLIPQSPFRTAESISEEMAHGIEKVFHPRGIELILHHYPWDALAAAAMPAFLRDNNVDGILMRPSNNRSLLLEFCRGRKAVLMGNSFLDLALPYVTADDYMGMRLALDYLFELGHRRIALVSLAPSMLIYRRRLDAYVAILRERGIMADDRFIKLHEGWVTGEDDASALCQRYVQELLSLDDPPTAIAATTDSFAAGLIRAAREQGVNVPKDLSVTGFGDQSFAVYVEPPITTVHMDQWAIGEAGALLLLQLMEGQGTSTQVLVRPTLVERRSCAAVPSRSGSRIVGQGGNQRT